MYATEHMWRSVHTLPAHSLLLPLWFWRQTMGHQTWLQLTSPAEPSPGCEKAQQEKAPVTKSDNLV